MQHPGLPGIGTTPPYLSQAWADALLPTLEATSLVEAVVLVSSYPPLQIIIYSSFDPNQIT